MTTITLPRAVLEQALEALENLQPIIGNGLLDKRQLAFIDPHLDVAITALRAALEQRAEPTWVCPESPEHRYAKPGHCEDCGKTLVQEQGCDHCNHPLYAATKCRVCGRVTEQAEPVDTDCHTQGICQRSGYGIGKQSDPQIEDRLARHGINPCPDCRGIGYDASGQLCWCQQNPSF